MKTVLKIWAALIVSSPLFSFAANVNDVQQTRLILDPHLLKIAGVTGSMIGLCVKGTDEDPCSDESSFTQKEIEPCLVYFVQDEAVIPYVKQQYRNLGFHNSVGVRFEKTLPPMIEQ